MPVELETFSFRAFSYLVGFIVFLMVISYLLYLYDRDVVKYVEDEQAPEDVFFYPINNN